MEVNFNIPTALQQLISSEQAHHYKIVPHKKENNRLFFKTSAKNWEDLKLELEIVFGLQVTFIQEKNEVIQKYLTVNYRKHKTLKEVSKLHFSEDFLITIIHEAKAIGSSDIHFEVFEESARIRFRIDGKLLERYLIPSLEYLTYVNRIKILAQLDISEKRLPQDGRINIKNEQDEFDIRVSVLPTLHGEKIVLRILAKDSASIELETLGFTDIELKRYKESVKNPNGIILISGPTGSGKTTTLYATLKLLNTLETNILTIEDPIEYTLEGINQVQLKENIGLDFASTLRTFLRQDPDIIMVGEIRDSATANMAIRAALTGHLVLSTIHTNSAWATISRLIDMGIPPFLIASTLKASVAQRLVRELCNGCKKKEIATDKIFPENFVNSKKLNYHFTSQGCETCHHTGYLGRKAIYEIIPITTELINYIKINALEINIYLQENNINTLRSNAIKLIENGTTSVEEVYSLLTL